MNKSVFVISAGGHTKVLLECLCALGNYVVSGMIETDQNKIGQEILGVKIISQDFFLENYPPSKAILVNGLGSVRNPTARKNIFLYFKKLGYNFLTLIHPTAYIAKEVILGEGCQILTRAVLQLGCQISDNVIINTGATIDHDCVIAYHSHIAPGVTVCGDVSIGKVCHIGAKATILQGIQIEDNCLVAAGAVVISNVLENSCVAGVPAKPI